MNIDSLVVTVGKKTRTNALSSREKRRSEVCLPPPVALPPRVMAPAAADADIRQLVGPEMQRLLAGLRESVATELSTREAALKFLSETGIYDAEGQLAPPYRHEEETRVAAEDASA
ncbi:MAG: hypothetical protein HQL51_13695 [Magnetococcales bacterium]|nr:hypothetical protein [Magnetococcales bacterium]